jgi:hypothetical protein
MSGQLRCTLCKQVFDSQPEGQSKKLDAFQMRLIRIGPTTIWDSQESDFRRRQRPSRRNSGI